MNKEKRLQVSAPKRTASKVSRGKSSKSFEKQPVTSLRKVICRHCWKPGLKECIYTNHLFLAYG